MRFSIIKREPPYFFENIHEDLNRFLKDTFGDLELQQHTNSPIKRNYHPAVELKEKKDRFLVKVELPNVSKEDINLELSENALSIKAESKFEECKEDENIKTTEFRYGSYSRVIPFDEPVNLEDAKTSFENGVLKVEVMKLYIDKKENIKKLEIH